MSRRAQALWIGIVLVVMLLLMVVACAQQQETVIQPLPSATRTKKPTFTAMPPATDTPTITPLPTSSPQPTATPPPTNTHVPTNTPIPPTPTPEVVTGFITGVEGDQAKLFEIDVFSAPGGEVAAKVRHGSPVELGERKDGFVKVIGSGVDGWVREANVVDAEPVAAQQMYVSAREAANLRNGPNGQVSRSIARGAEVYSFGCEGEWCRIGVPGEAGTLWIHESLLSASPVS